MRPILIVVCWLVLALVSGIISFVIIGVSWIMAVLYGITAAMIGIQILFPEEFDRNMPPE